MNMKPLITEIHRSTEKLAGVLQDIPDEKFNTKPGPQRWSPGDVAEHLNILEGFTNQILQGGAKEPERDPLEKVERIKKTFKDEGQLTAGEPVQPTDQNKDKEETIKRLLANRHQLIEILESEKPDEECLEFKHGLFGHLTRAEWGYYHVYHTERHIHQIRKSITG